MFQPLMTARLVVRAVVASDVDALHARRNEPEVARLQAWLLPWPREEAERVVSDSLGLGGPTDGQWWMATIEDRDSGTVVGDLALHLSNGSRTGEVGYSLGSHWWGRGYAVEALDALIDWVFATHPISRLKGRLHPDNRASAMVLERTGFVFEGHTRLSFWLGEDNSDDWIYGLTRADRQEWRDRPRSVPQEVRLVEITNQNRDEALSLRTHHTQRAFVAPMSQSFAEALVPDDDEGWPVRPWLRLVEADGHAVGFVMLARSEREAAHPYLWRLLIDRLHQRRGIAGRVLDLWPSRPARGAPRLWRCPGPRVRAHPGPSTWRAVSSRLGACWTARPRPDCRCPDGSVREEPRAQRCPTSAACALRRACATLGRDVHGEPAPW